MGRYLAASISLISLISLGIVEDKLPYPATLAIVQVSFCIFSLVCVHVLRMSSTRAAHELDSRRASTLRATRARSRACAARSCAAQTIRA